MSLAECCVILVVALVVLGPERLSPMARQLGRWIARCRALQQEATRFLKND